MSTIVPRRAREILEGNPVAGTADEWFAAGIFAGSAADNALHCAHHLHGGLGTLARMRSSGIDALAGRLAEHVVPGAARVHTSARAGRAALLSFAETVDRIHARATQLVTEINDALSEIRRCAHDIEVILQRIDVHDCYEWHIGPPMLMPQPDAAAKSTVDSSNAAGSQSLLPLFEQEWRNVSFTWRRAADDVLRLRTEWRELVAEREGAEKQVARELDRTDLGRLLTIAGAGAASRRITVALGVSGEIRGRRRSQRRPGDTHPLLWSLIGSDRARWDAPPDPSEVARAWSALSKGEQERLIAEAPWAIGNLPGLPFSVRDRANRELVQQYRQHPHTLDASQLQLLSELERILRNEAGQNVPDPPIQVIALDISGPVPNVAVSYGRADSATHVTWEVPGMDTDAHRGIANWDLVSRNVYRAQSDLIGSTEEVAVVAWLSYDTPGLPTSGDFGVLGSRSAVTGAARLVAELDGAHAAQAAAGREPKTNVLAHSYGTSIASIALTQVANPVDTFVMMGSAGIDTSYVASVNDLRVAETERGQRGIYSTHASQDRLAPLGAGAAARAQPNPHAIGALGFHRSSPVLGDVLTFSSEGDASRDLRGTNGHSVAGSGKRSGIIGITASRGQGYLDPGTQSLDSVARITTSRVTGMHPEFFVSAPECVTYTHGRGVAVPIRSGCP